MTLFGRFENDFNFDTEWKAVGRCCIGGITESPTAVTGLNRRTMSQTSRDNKRVNPESLPPINGSTSNPVARALTSPVTVPTPICSLSYYSICNGPINVTESNGVDGSLHYYDSGELIQGNHVNLNKSVKSGSGKLNATPSRSLNGNEKKKPKWLVQLIKKKKAEEASAIAAATKNYTYDNNMYENMDYIKGQVSTCLAPTEMRNENKMKDFTNLIRGKEYNSNPEMKSIPKETNNLPLNQIQDPDSGLQPYFWRVVPSSSSTIQPAIEISDDYEVEYEEWNKRKKGESTSFHCFNPPGVVEELRRGKWKDDAVEYDLKDHEKYYNIHELCQEGKRSKNEGQKEVINREGDQQSFHNHHHPHYQHHRQVKEEREIYEVKIQDGKKNKKSKEVEENEKYLGRGSEFRSGDHLNPPCNKFNKANNSYNINNSETTRTIVTSKFSTSSNRAAGGAEIVYSRKEGPVRGILKKNKTLKNDSDSHTDTTNCSLFALTPPVSSSASSSSSHVDSSTIFHHSPNSFLQSKESEHEVPLLKSKITISNKPDPTTAGVTSCIVLSHSNSVSTSPTFKGNEVERLNSQTEIEVRQHGEKEGNGIIAKKRVNESRLQEQNKEAKLNQSSQDFNSFQCTSSSRKGEQKRAVSSLAASSSEISILPSIASKPTGTQIVCSTQQVARKSVFNDSNKKLSDEKSFLINGSRSHPGAPLLLNPHYHNQNHQSNSHPPPAVKKSFNNVVTRKNSSDTEYLLRETNKYSSKKKTRINGKEQETNTTTSTGGNRNCNQKHHRQQTPDQFYLLAGSNQDLSTEIPSYRESDRELNFNQESEEVIVKQNCQSVKDKTSDSRRYSSATSTSPNKTNSNGLSRRPSLPPKGIVRSRIKQFAKFNPQSISISRNKSKNQQVVQNFYQVSSLKKSKTCCFPNEIAKCEQTLIKETDTSKANMTVDVVEKVMAQNKSEIEQNGQNYCNGSRNRHLSNHHEKVDVVNNGMNIYYDRSSSHHHNQKSRESNQLPNNLHPPSSYYSAKRPSSVSSSNHDSTLSSNGSLINSTDVSPGEEDEEEDQVHQHHSRRRGTDHLLIRDNLSHDSLDELEYGPGIVAKLKSKFLKYSSITSSNSNNNNNNNSVVRRNKINGLKLKRSSSLENILNNDHHHDEDESHDFHGLVIIHQESDEDQDTLKPKMNGMNLKNKNQVRRASESVITSNGYHLSHPLIQNKAPVIKSNGSSKDPASMSGSSPPSVRNNGTTGIMQPVIVNALDRVKKSEITSSSSINSKKIAPSSNNIGNSNNYNNGLLSKSTTNKCEKLLNGSSSVHLENGKNDNHDQTHVVNQNNSKTLINGTKSECESEAIINSNKNDHPKNSSTSRRGSVFLKQYLNTVQNAISSTTSPTNVSPSDSSSANNRVINHVNLVNRSSPSPTSSPPAKSSTVKTVTSSSPRTNLNNDQHSFSSSSSSPSSSNNSSPDNNKFNEASNNKKHYQFTRRASHNQSRGILLNKSAFNNKNSLVLKRAKSLETLLLDASPESVSRSCTGNSNDSSEDNGCEDDNLNNDNELIANSVVTTPMAIVNPTVHDLQEGNTSHQVSSHDVDDSGRSPLIEQVSNIISVPVAVALKGKTLDHNNYDHPSSNDVDVNVTAAIDDHLSGAVEIKVIEDCESRKEKEVEEDLSSSAKCLEKITIPNNHNSSSSSSSLDQIKKEVKSSDQTVPTVSTSFQPKISPTKPIPPVRSLPGIPPRGLNINRRTSLPVLTDSTTESNGLSGSDKIAGSLRRGSTLPSVKPMIALKPKSLGNNNPINASTAPNNAVTNGIKKDDLIPVSRPPRTKKGSLSSSSNCNNVTSGKSSSSITLSKEAVSNDSESVKKLSNNVIKNKETSSECIHETVRSQQDSLLKGSDANDSCLKVEKEKDNKEKHVSNSDSPSVTISKSTCENNISSSSPQITSLPLKSDSCPSTDSTVCGNNENSKSKDILECMVGKALTCQSDSQSGRQISSSCNNNSPSTTILTETTPACNVIQDLVTLSPQVKPAVFTPATPEQEPDQKKPSAPDALEHQQQQQRISTSSSVSDEIFPLIISKSQTASSITPKTMTPLPTQVIQSSSSMVSQPVPAPRRTTNSTTTPNQSFPSPPLPTSLPPPAAAKAGISANSSSKPLQPSSSRGPPPPVSNGSSCMIFDFRGKDVKPSLAISSPFGRSAVISNDDDENEDYRGSMDVPPPSGLVFVGENEVVGRGSLLKSRNKKLKIHFNDEATATFEYPSESSMIAFLLEEQRQQQQHKLNGSESNQWNNEEVDSNCNKKSDGGLNEVGGGSSNHFKGVIVGGVTTNNNKSNGLASYKPSFLASQMRESSSFELGVSRLKRAENTEPKITGSLIGTEGTLPTTLTTQSNGVGIVGGALIIDKTTTTMVDSSSSSSMVNQQIVSEGDDSTGIGKTGSWSTSTVSDLLF